MTTTNIIKQGKWLSFMEKDGYEFFHRHNKPEAVAIIAKTNDNKIILVAQHRVPHSKPILEIPAGLIDPGETPIETAQRELLEETGYVAENFELIYPNVTTTPGICTEKIHFVLATGLTKEAEGGGLASENEYINIITEDIKNINLFKLSADYLIDMKIFVGLYVLSEYI